jgi:uncharacterized protein (DUF1697 family)
MRTYVVLLRGINVGGQNKVPMRELKASLESLGFEAVQTYIQSGNVLLDAPSSPALIAKQIEAAMYKSFTLDGPNVRALVLPLAAYRAMVQNAPQDFGSDPARYLCEAIFLIGVSAQRAMRDITVRPGIDAAWPRKGVIYYRRPALSHPDATKTHLSKVIQLPVYQHMSKRNWTTVVKLLELATSET